MTGFGSIRNNGNTTFKLSNFLCVYYHNDHWVRRNVRFCRLFELRGLELLHIRLKTAWRWLPSEIRHFLWRFYSSLVYQCGW